MTKQQIEGWNFMSEVLDGSLAMDQFDFIIFFDVKKIICDHSDFFKILIVRAKKNVQKERL